MPPEMILRDPKAKGKYVKVGESFIKLSDILDAKVSNNQHGKKQLTIKRKGMTDYIYQGEWVDVVKKAIDDNRE